MKVDNLISFAELVFEEDQKQIEEHYKWVEFITPLFKKETGLEYRYEYEHLYSKENKNWLDNMRERFNK